LQMEQKGSTMTPPPKKTSSPALEKQLLEIENQAAEKNIHIHYDRLEAAGLKLKDGMCKLDGEYHIFVDRRKSVADKIDIIQAFLDQPISEITEKVDE